MSEQVVLPALPPAEPSKPLNVVAKLSPAADAEAAPPDEEEAAAVDEPEAAEEEPAAAGAMDEWGFSATKAAYVANAEYAAQPKA